MCYVAGQYCILKKGACPVNFHEGFIYWDDAAPWFSGRDTRQSSKGQLLFSGSHSEFVVMILIVLLTFT